MSPVFGITNSFETHNILEREWNVKHRAAIYTPVTPPPECR
jgi:hypothetical protein